MPKFKGDVLLTQHNCCALHPRAGLKASQKVLGHLISSSACSSHFIRNLLYFNRQKNDLAIVSQRRKAQYGCGLEKCQSRRTPLDVASTEQISLNSARRPAGAFAALYTAASVAFTGPAAAAA